MNNTPPIHRDNLSASNEVNTDVLFVDLDETLIEGTATIMSDQELIDVGLIKETFNKIKQAKALGVKVIMATRNTRETIERVLDLRPDLKVMFNETLSCLGSKSSQINAYLQSQRIRAENAIFIDDTEGELADVERNTNGVKAVKTGKTNNLTLKKAA